LTAVTITNVNSTRTRTGVGAIDRYGWGSELSSPWGLVIGICIRSWGAGSGSGVDAVPVVDLDLDIVQKGPYLFKASLVLSLSSLDVRLHNG